MLYKTPEQLLKKAEEVQDKTFREIDKNNRLSKKQKGTIIHLQNGIELKFHQHKYAQFYLKQMIMTK